MANIPSHMRIQSGQAVAHRPSGTPMSLLISIGVGIGLSAAAAVALFAGLIH